MAQKKKAHFIGIGGIGISALAQLFYHEGWKVVGTNDEPSPYTLGRIEEKGVQIFYTPDVANIDPDTDLIVYSAAWETRAPEFMKEVRALGIPLQSYFEALGSVSKDKRTVAIAGTHGKTTTTGMTTRILRDADVSPTAVVGSVLKDFGSNFIPGDSEWFVVESCEYRRHFLNLSPEVLVITNIELDHTDYYKDLEDVQDAFRALAKKVPAHGCIITNPSDPHIAPVLDGLSVPVIDYTQEPAFGLRFPGEFNRMNARAAAAASRVVTESLDDVSIAESLAAFEGTWRRFEYLGDTAAGTKVYDDYAHHPSAIGGTITAAHDYFPAKKIVVVFHPHMYTRTRDFMDEFARVLMYADMVHIAPIFPAREAPIEGVTSEVLLGKIPAEKRGELLTTKEAFEEVVEGLTDEHILFTMGAGDIYLWTKDIISTPAA